MATYPTDVLVSESCKILRELASNEGQVRVKLWSDVSSLTQCSLEIGGHRTLGRVCERRPTQAPAELCVQQAASLSSFTMLAPPVSFYLKRKENSLCALMFLIVWASSRMIRYQLMA
jgi:hypothetical protein